MGMSHANRKVKTAKIDGFLKKKKKKLIFIPELPMLEVWPTKRIIISGLGLFKLLLSILELFHSYIENKAINKQEVHLVRNLIQFCNFHGGEKHEEYF